MDKKNKELTTPPPASQERSVAPWPDFAGNPIHAGDRIKHPDGVSGTVVYLPMLGPGGEAWRVVYDGEVTLSRLNLQIGDKGQAVVASPPSSAADGGNDPDGTLAVELRAATETQRLAAVSGSSPPSREEPKECRDPVCAVWGDASCKCAAEQAKPDRSELIRETNYRLWMDGNGGCEPPPEWLSEQTQAGEIDEAIEWLESLDNVNIANRKQAIALLLRLAGGVTAPYKLTMRSGVASCNDNPIGYFTDERTAYLVGDLIRAIDKNGHPEYSGFDVVAALGAK